MKSAKDEVRSLLDTLPDDASLEDIQYHLYVRQKVLRGIEASDNGKSIPHDEALKRMSRWLDE